MDEDGHHSAGSRCSPQDTSNRANLMKKTPTLRKRLQVGNWGGSHYLKKNKWTEINSNTWSNENLHFKD